MHSLQILPKLPRGAKILFVRLRSLGDVLLTTPLYASLKAWRPDLKIAVLVEEPNHEVLEGNPDLDWMIVLPSRQSHDGRLLAMVKIFLKIRALRFDCCINLHGGSTSALYTRLSGARYRVGLKMFHHAYLYNVRIDPVAKARKKLHTVEYQIEWLRQLGLPAMEIPPLKLIPRPAAESLMTEKLVVEGISPNIRYAVIQPASKFVTKEWTDKGFAEIADFLNTRFAMQVVMAGSREEVGKLLRIASLVKSHLVVFDSLTISELASLIRGASFFLGNDSGPTHMAAAFSVPVVVLFGSSDSQVWYPWQTSYRIVQNLFDCNPCPGYKCLVYDEPRCILGITPEQVKTAICSLLEPT